ncbi:MAG: amidohydrolase [Planctomycetaceae bacterium]|nr:amidohydrolase [Planctomycetaceae bacterium]
MEESQPEHWSHFVDAAIDLAFVSMCEVRRHLHRFPEPSHEEVATTVFLVDRLKDAGFAPHPLPSGRGVLVDGGQDSGPRIGFRADIDALRIQDAKNTPYSSRVDGIMHACGHDGHTACVFGAIQALAALDKAKQLPWPVRWRALFQPAEETNRGALEMVENGALEDVQALLSLHMDPSREVGSIGVRVGAFTADCNELEIEVRGRGAHAARPHESRDPIAAAAQMISAIYLFVPRSTDSHEPVVVSFGQIQGGHNANVIPDRVLVRGTLRTLHEKVSKDTIAHIERLARGIAEASGTSIHVRSVSGPPSVQNDRQLTDLIQRVAVDLLGADRVRSIPKPSMGGEDFANYLKYVPGSMFRLGCAVDVSKAAPLHSPEFDLDEESLRIGAKILARGAIEWSNPGRKET